MTSALTAFALALASGTIRVIDLTHTLTPEFPAVVMPPELGQCAPFRMEEVSQYDECGPAWYWNDFSMGEHTGTHLDAPIHWVTGKELPNNAVDIIPPAHFLAPACVIDCSTEFAIDPDFVLTIPFVEAREAKYGHIPPKSWVLFRIDWHKRPPRQYVNLLDDGPHSPGPAPAVVKWLVEQRDVQGFDTEAVGIDAGQAAHFTPPYPAHHYMYGRGRYGLQCMVNLDQLPSTGPLLLAAPLKIRQGSGRPLRVLALVETQP